jgi:AmiR/NasT family two-component response regulator
LDNDPDQRSHNAAASARWDGNHPSGPGAFHPVLKVATRAELLARVAALEGTLTTLPAIEQAKGALMVTYGISADAAFALLRFHS